jgi:hypothetical protein
MKYGIVHSYKGYPVPVYEHTGLRGRKVTEVHDGEHVAILSNNPGSATGMLIRNGHGIQGYVSSNDVKLQRTYRNKPQSILTHRPVHASPFRSPHGEEGEME